MPVFAVAIGMDRRTASANFAPWPHGPVAPVARGLVSWPAHAGHGAATVLASGPVAGFCASSVAAAVVVVAPGPPLASFFGWMGFPLLLTFAAPPPQRSPSKCTLLCGFLSIDQPELPPGAELIRASEFTLEPVARTVRHPPPGSRPEHLVSAGPEHLVSAGCATSPAAAVGSARRGDHPSLLTRRCDL